METRIIATLDYTKYLLPAGQMGSDLLAAFTQMTKVKSKGYGKEEIYIPEEELPSVEFKIVFAHQVRPETPEEIEDDKIKTLESSLTYNKGRVDELLKKVADLEIINKKLAECTEKGD